MQNYLQYSTLKDNDPLLFEAWASNFGKMVTAIELALEGSGYQAKTRLKTWSVSRNSVSQIEKRQKS